jgi:ubiquinol-cytochrome c reductase iron-sulfur subunit
MVTMPLPSETTRRNVLYTATATLAVAGLAAAAWPFIDQMNPDARVQAAGDIVDVDLATLHPGELRVLRWHELPIFVARRTEAALKAMQADDFVRVLIDSHSDMSRQPDYAKNWHRSIDPAIAVLVGVCTYCGCIPHYLSDDSDPLVGGPVGGYLCPCCASHFDPAGRAHVGIARANLRVPPYDFSGPMTIRIGKDPPGADYAFKSFGGG